MMTYDEAVNMLANVAHKTYCDLKFSGAIDCRVRIKYSAILLDNIYDKQEGTSFKDICAGFNELVHANISETYLV